MEKVFHFCKYHFFNEQMSRCNYQKNFFAHLLTTSIAYSFSSKTVCKKSLKTKTAKLKSRSFFVYWGSIKLTLGENGVYLCVCEQSQMKKDMI